MNCWKTRLVASIIWSTCCIMHFQMDLSRPLKIIYIARVGDLYCFTLASLTLFELVGLCHNHSNSARWSKFMPCTVEPHNGYCDFRAFRRLDISDDGPLQRCAQTPRAVLQWCGYCLGYDGICAGLYHDPIVVTHLRRDVPSIVCPHHVPSADDHSGVRGTPGQPFFHGAGAIAMEDFKT